MPLGKGYFMIRFSCEDDLVKIWSGGPWKFENQLLRLTKWEPDFDPDIQRISHAIVWVKFPKLKQQYWDYEILMSMGRCLGYPIGIDKPTTERDFGFYVSVLVDLDLSKHIPNQILVEVPNGVDFLQDVEFSKLPKFCAHCKCLGHLMNECKALQKEMGAEKSPRTAFIHRDLFGNQIVNMTIQKSLNCLLANLYGCSLLVFDAIWINTFVGEFFCPPLEVKIIFKPCLPNIITITCKKHHEFDR